MKAYLRAKIEELETNSKVNNVRDLYRGINDFKKGYQPRTDIVKDEKVDIVADCHSILDRWRKHISQLQSVHGANDVRQTEIRTAQPLAPGRSALEVEMAIGKLKSHKSPGTDQIPPEFIKAGGTTICYETHKLFSSIWNKEELPQEWEQSIIVPIYKKGDKTDCSNYRGISSCHLHSVQHTVSNIQCPTYSVQHTVSNILLSRLTAY